MTLNEIITYAQTHKLDFDKPVTGILEMNESIPLNIVACHGSVNNNVVLHAAPIIVVAKSSDRIKAVQCWYRLGDMFQSLVFADDGSPCGELVEE